MKHEGKFIALMAIIAIVLTMWDVAAHAHDSMRDAPELPNECPPITILVDQEIP